MSATAWGAITVEQVDPSSWLVLATGVAAALAVVVDGVWRWARGVVTIAHEAGHAVAALVTGPAPDRHPPPLRHVGPDPVGRAPRGASG